MTHDDIDAPTRRGGDPNLPPNHPVNALSPLRKALILAALSYSSFCNGFTIAIILAAFPQMGATFGMADPHAVAPAVGYMLLGVACGPLLWNPLCKSIGRRPVYLLGSALFIPCCVWMALCRTFPLFCAARVVAGVVHSFSQTVPPATIAEIYRPEVRGRKMGIFALAGLLAPFCGPFLGGFLISGTDDWPACFWLCTGMAGLQLALYVAFVPETLWVPSASDRAPGAVAPVVEEKDVERLGDAETVGTEKDVETVKTESQMSTPTAFELEKAEQTRVEVVPSAYQDGHVGAAWYPWREPRRWLHETLAPVRMMGHLTVLLPSVFNGVCFGWGVGACVTLSGILQHAPYAFSSIGIGCSYMGFAVGGLLGLFGAGVAGDMAVAYWTKRRGHRQPDFRLWAGIPNVPLTAVGLVIFGVAAQREWHWAVMLVGAGIFQYGVVGLTGVLITYVLECDLARSMDTQATFNFWKCMGGFTITYYVAAWIEHSGLAMAFAYQAIIVLVLGAALLASGIVWGAHIRARQRTDRG